MNKYGPRYYKPTLGVKYTSHPNFGGEWYFAGGKKSDPKTYTVEMTAKGFTCDCPGFKFRGKCKHTIAIGETVDWIVA